MSTTVIAPVAATAAPEVVVTIDAIADQLDLSPVTLGATVTVDGSPATPSAYAWRVDGATTGISDATAAASTYTPTTAGRRAVSLTVTIDGIDYGATTPRSYRVGSPAGYVMTSIDCREAVAVSGDGPYTVDGITATLSDSAGHTVSITEADGLYARNVGGTDPKWSIDMDAVLLSRLGHTMDPAAYDYVVVLHRKTTGHAPSQGVTMSVKDGDGTPSEVVVGASTSALWRQYSSTTVGMAGTAGKTWALEIIGAVCRQYNGTVDPDTWDRDLSDLTLVGREWGDPNVAVGGTEAAALSGAATIYMQPRNGNGVTDDVLDVLMLDIGYRPR